MIEHETLRGILTPGLLGVKQSTNAALERAYTAVQATTFASDLLDARRMQGLIENKSPEELTFRQQGVPNIQATDIALFHKNGRGIVINEHGVFVPRSIFGLGTNIRSEITRTPEGRALVRIFSEGQSREMHMAARIENRQVPRAGIRLTDLRRIQAKYANLTTSSDAFAARKAEEIAREDRRR